MFKYWDIFKQILKSIKKIRVNLMNKFYQSFDQFKNTDLLIRLMVVFSEKFVKVWTNFEIFIVNFESLKYFESFKENFNKNLEKFNEILNFFYHRFSLLAEAWGVPHHLKIFRVWKGAFPSFPLATPWWQYKTNWIDYY